MPPSPRFSTMWKAFARFYETNFRPFAGIMLTMIVFGGGIVMASGWRVFDTRVEMVGDKRWLQITNYERERMQRDNELRIKELTEKNVQEKFETELSSIKAQNERNGRALESIRTEGTAKLDKVVDLIEKLRTPSKIQ